MARLAPFALFICLATTAALAQPAPEQPRTITTSGESVVYVVPDEVVVTLGVETFSPNLDESKTANDVASKKLLGAVKGLGVEERHVQTDTLQIEIRYKTGRPSDGIDGYISRRAYSVTLKDAKKLEPAIDAALKNGANQIMGVSYRTNELRKHRDNARKMAIKAAREKAEALAGELGAKIGAPRMISEGYGGYAGAFRGNSFNSMQNSAQFVPDGGGEGGETTPMGQIGVNASVNVVFDLVP